MICARLTGKSAAIVLSILVLSTWVGAESATAPAPLRRTVLAVGTLFVVYKNDPPAKR